MPTVMRIDALRVVIWPNDHRPAHVHVTGGGCEACFGLGCPEGPTTLQDNYGFGRSDLGRVEQALAAAVTTLCEQWRAIHGDF